MENNFQKELNEYKKMFYNTYHKTVYPIMVNCESERKAIFQNMILIEIILTCVFGCLLYYYVLSDNRVVNDSEGICICIMAIPIMIAILAIVQILFNCNFTKKIKKKCLAPILKIFGDNISWNEDGHETISDYEFEDSELFSYFNRRYDDDVFTGTYKGIPTDICETDLKYESGSGKNRHIHTVFKGVIVKFKSNKIVKSKTIVADKKGYGIANSKNFVLIYVLAIIIGVTLSILTKPSVDSADILFISIYVIGIVLVTAICLFAGRRKLKKLKLEDVKFDKRFTVQSEDEVEGRYLVTPSFMERFLNLKTAFNGRGASCSFYGDNIMFAIATNKNLFEIGNLFHRLDDPKQAQIFFDELSSVLMLADYFKLDEKTGL